MLAGHDDPLMMREIAYYQAASYDWKQGLLAWKEPARAGEVFAIKKNNGNKHVAAKQNLKKESHHAL